MKAKLTRIFSVIFLILVIASIAYGDMVFVTLPFFRPHNAIMEQMHSRYPNGVWVKPDTDLEQLKQDYHECRGKGEKLCMMIKGYTWNNIFSFE
jgi:hypothetical protein